MSRRTALRAAGVAAAGAAVSQLPRAAHAHDLRPNDPAYAFDEYESIVNRDVTIRQVYEWPNINNPTIYTNISNGLNGTGSSAGIRKCESADVRRHVMG